MTYPSQSEPIVITGIGLVTALGNDRETTWNNIKQGKCGIREFQNRADMPHDISLAAEVFLPTDFARPDELKVIGFSNLAFNEALHDSGIDLELIDPAMIGLASTGHMGDLRQYYVQEGRQSSEQQIVPWWTQWLPHTSTVKLADQRKLQGPRLCYSTACASSLIALIQSVRAIRQGTCDVMVAGGGEQIDPLFAAGFSQMRALSKVDRPENACQPFDQDRSGFVMGEGAAFMVIERLSHAIARGATIYAEVLSERFASQAHHITSLDMEDEALTYLINETIRAADLKPDDIEYINAHGTGTVQNDITEINCINKVFGSHANQLQVSSTKSQIGHLVSASGSAELAVTLLGMRDGIAPPTINLHKPESTCQFDCVANQAQDRQFKHAMKFSMAFGGHLAGIAIRRYDAHANSFKYATVAKAA